jgi:hypothetical protein
MFRSTYFLLVNLLLVKSIYAADPTPLAAPLTPDQVLATARVLTDKSLVGSAEYQTAEFHWASARYTKGELQKAYQKVFSILWDRAKKGTADERVTALIPLAPRYPDAELAMKAALFETSGISLKTHGFTSFWRPDKFDDRFFDKIFRGKPPAVSLELREQAFHALEEMANSPLTIEESRAQAQGLVGTYLEDKVAFPEGSADRKRMDFHYANLRLSQYSERPKVSDADLDKWLSFTGEHAGGDPGLARFWMQAFKAVQYRNGEEGKLRDPKLVDKVAESLGSFFRERSETAKLFEPLDLWKGAREMVHPSQVARFDRSLKESLLKSDGSDPCEAACNLIPQLKAWMDTARSYENTAYDGNSREGWGYSLGALAGQYVTKASVFCSSALEGVREFTKRLNTLPETRKKEDAALRHRRIRR